MKLDKPEFKFLKKKKLMISKEGKKVQKKRRIRNW
jgi:hypothetical protein